MNGCDLGNVSLRLIGNYIAESPHLEELSLQNVRDILPASRCPTNIASLTLRIFRTDSR
jgi:hypothetical protein